MKIICKNKVIDLSKFETVRCRVSLLGREYGYPVEAIRHESSGGLFGGIGTVEEEIIRFKKEELALELVKEISEKWISGEKLFDVNKWIEEYDSDDSSRQGG